MKALLIQTDKQMVEEIELPTPTKDNTSELLEELYKLLLINAGSRLVEQVYLPFERYPTSVILVDEEGRLRQSTRNLGSFMLFGRVFRGRGIVLSETIDDEGEANWSSATIELDYLQNTVTFYDSYGRRLNK